MTGRHILTVVGARPQFVKAAAVSRAIAAHSGLGETLLRTGQHFDPEMSQVFFDELEIPPPCVNLGIHGGSHGEKSPISCSSRATPTRPSPGRWPRPSSMCRWLISRPGCARSTGRCRKRSTACRPTHQSALLFCPTETAVRNLRREGIVEGVDEIGDVMYDAALFTAA